MCALNEGCPEDDGAEEPDAEEVTMLVVDDDSFKANFNGSCCLTWITLLEVCRLLVNLDVETRIILESEVNEVSLFDMVLKLYRWFPLPLGNTLLALLTFDSTQELGWASQSAEGDKDSAT